jgi:MFS family permease
MAWLLLKQNRNYRLLFSGAGASNLSDGVGALAFPWLATLISTNPFDLALVAFATRLPWFLLSLPVGVITDRADRQRLMVRADLVRMGLAFGVVALIAAGPPLPAGENATWMITALAGLAFLMGAAEVVRDNAAQTALPSLVEKRDLESANGQIWSIEQIMGSFVGPPLAGLLIALAVPAPFLFEAIGFALAAFAVWAIAFPPRLNRGLPAGFWVELIEGAKWIRQHGVLLQLAIMLGLMNALSLAAMTYLVLFAQEILTLEAVGYGILLTAGAAGGVTGGLCGPWIAARLGPQQSVILALFGMALPFSLLYLTSSVLVVGAVLFAGILFGMLWNVVTVSYRQRVVPDLLLGRVNSIYRFFGWGMMPLGALASGAFMAWAEPEMGRELALRVLYLGVSGGLGLMFLYGLCCLRLPRT